MGLVLGSQKDVSKQCVSIKRLRASMSMTSGSKGDATRSTRKYKMERIGAENLDGVRLIISAQDPFGAGLCGAYVGRNAVHSSRRRFGPAK